MNSQQRKLVLIRHAMPVMDYEQPASTWPLSDEGAVASGEIADELRDLGLVELVSSEEPKMVGTAREIASALNIDWRTAPGLHEHERDAYLHMGDVEWRGLVRRLFEHPDELVMGRETANQALSRFSQAVEAATADGPPGCVGIVSGGTVISLYASSATGEDPYSIWVGLKLPDYVVLPSR